MPAPKIHPGHTHAYKQQRKSKAQVRWQGPSICQAERSKSLERQESVSNKGNMSMRHWLQAHSKAGDSGLSGASIQPSQGLVFIAVME